MATIKIDGREIPFEQGDTIIRAAHRVGIDIPHYCWHPGLSVAANCRMCLVEVLPPPGRPAMELDILRWDPEKNDYVPARKPKLLPACQQGCAPGMEVLSESSQHVAEARSAVQELLLLNHPVDCPICDQAGECRLQDYWLEHQRTGKRMRQEIVHKPKAVPFGPTIVYDAERCILCTRCVRVSAELAKDPVLSTRERGNLGEIVVAPGRQLDHNYSLMTEHVCPVGALTSSDFRFKARVWFLRSARTICQAAPRGATRTSTTTRATTRPTATGRARTWRSTSTGCATRACSRTSAPSKTACSPRSSGARTRASTRRCRPPKISSRHRRGRVEGRGGAVRAALERGQLRPVHPREDVPRASDFYVSGRPLAAATTSS